MSKLRATILGLAIGLGLVLFCPASALAQTFGEDAAEDYVTFWSGELRIIPQKDNDKTDTKVKIINLRTGDPVDFANNQKVDSADPNSNPMTLSGPADYFSGIGGLGGPTDELQVRILSTEPVTVWTGSDMSGSGNSWGSLIPAVSSPDDSFGRELGTEFIGFTMESLILIGEKDSTTTQIDINEADSSRSLSLTLDSSIPDCPTTLNSSEPVYPREDTPCYLHSGPENQAVYVNGFCDGQSCSSSDAFDQSRVLEISSTTAITALTGSEMLRPLGDAVKEVGTTIGEDNLMYRLVKHGIDIEGDTPPLVFGEVQTHNDGEAAKVGRTIYTDLTFAAVTHCEQDDVETCDPYFDEDIGWFGLDRNNVPDSSALEWGSVKTGGDSWKQISFSESFSESPVLIVETQSFNNLSASVYTEARNVGTDGAEIRFCEYDSGTASTCDSSAADETLVWLAVEPGQLELPTQNGTAVIGEAGKASQLSGDTWKGVTFSTSFASAPVVLSTPQTQNGSEDPSGTELRNITGTDFEIRHCEYDNQESCDGNHPAETNGWLAIDPSALEQFDGLNADKNEILRKQRENQLKITESPTFSETDWSFSPPSRAPGDAGQELGTEFTTYVREQLTIFPTEDNTDVEITDLNEGDDSISFTLDHGDPTGSELSIYTPTTSAASGSALTPRNSNPSVELVTNNGNPFDSDIVRVESNKPILLYQGPAQSDVNEFADVAFSVPTGSLERVIYTYGQNFGDSNDLQLFAFVRDTVVDLNSLSYTKDFQDDTHHDFLIDFDVSVNTEPDVTPTPSDSKYTTFDAPTDIQWFGSGAWDGELTRIETTRPITVISGDYDNPHFGSYIPFVSADPPWDPVAKLDPKTDLDGTDLCPGATLEFDGSGSFDQDDINSLPEIRQYDWDFGDGSSATNAGPNVEHTYDQSGSYTATLTVTDNDGQTDTDSAEFEILPESDPACNEPPNPSCAPVTLTADNMCTGCATADQIDAGSADPDGDDSKLSFSLQNECLDATGTTTATLTVTDQYGATDSCTAQVTLEDNTAPEVVSCPADKTFSLGSECLLDLTELAESTDNCSDDQSELFSYSFSGPGTDSESVVFTDDAGNQSDRCTQTVTTLDETAPTLSCPADQTLLLGDSCSIEQKLVAEGSDNCIETLSDSNKVSAEAPMSVSLKFEVSDNASKTADSDNVAECSSQVTVDDQTAPDATCPVEREEVVLSADNCEASPSYEATADDNCAATLSDSHKYDFESPGSATNTYTLDDGYGNTATCDQTIFAVDETAPDVDCPTDATLELDPKSCKVTKTFEAAGQDACSGEVSTSVEHSFDEPGTLNTTYVVRDDSRNEVTCRQTVEAVDNTDPSLTCPADETLNLGQDCKVQSTYTADGNDTCSGALSSTKSFFFDEPDSSSKTYTVRDNSGNTASCKQKVTAVDEIQPTISCPDDKTLELGSSCSVDTEYTASGQDHCAGTLTDKQRFSANSPGSDTLTYEVADNGGNTRSCQQKVEAVDNTSPQIEQCPAPEKLVLSADTCEASKTYTATASDNCASQIASDHRFAFKGPGAGSHTYQLIDGNGNASTCSQRVTAVDETAPSLQCPANDTLKLDPDTCEASASYTANGQDACSGQLATERDYSFEEPTSKSKTYSVQDNSGNTRSCRQTVTAEDRTAPDLTCPVDKTLELGSSCTVQAEYTATADDACSGTLTDTQSFSATSPTTETADYSVADQSGNASSCHQQLKAVDNTKPTVTVGTPEVEIWPPNHKCNSYDILQKCDITVTDNCSGSNNGLDTDIIEATSDEPFDATGGGDGNHADDIEIVDSNTVKLRAERQGASDGRIYKVTVEATDPSGNSSTGTCTFTVPHDQSPQHTPADSGVSETCTGDDGCTCAPKSDDDGRDDGDNGSGDDGGGPGDGGPPGDGDDGQSSGDAKAISFAAFCTAKQNYDTDDVEITGTGTNDEGEATSITWESDTEVSTVVLKAGTRMSNHSGGTSGEATSGEGTDAGSSQSPSDPCPAGEELIVKDENVDDGETSGESDAGQNGGGNNGGGPPHGRGGGGPPGP